MATGPLRPLFNLNSTNHNRRFTVPPNHNRRFFTPPKPPTHATHQPPHPRRRNPNRTVRSRSTRSKKPNPNDVSETEPDESSCSEAPADPGTVYRFLYRMRGGLELDWMGLEILSIALPAALALAADPITSLVDTAYIGHLGSVELAGVGVSISVFNLVSKLFNVPLLNITTSFVAEEQATVDYGEKNSRSTFVAEGPTSSVEYQKKLLPSVSASLALAAGIGIAEAVFLSFGSSFVMNLMGIPIESPMRMPAEQFLSLRAFGAPPVVLALAAQGTFRGFKDTKTPLYAVIAGNLLNAILDPILIFLFGLGVGGAAISTVISEYVIAFILLWQLNAKVMLISPSFNGEKIVRYLKSGGLLIARTIAVLLTMTLSTSMAAREGPVPMAGHQICLQVWLAISLLNDALALAGQAILANFYAQGNYRQARHVIYKVLQIGFTSGLALAIILFLGFETISGIFTTDTDVLEITRSGVLILVGFISSLFLLAAAQTFGLAGVWTGLFLFMSLRVVAGFWRVRSKVGPWKLILSRTEMQVEEND
ncbi:hypothetical protein QJS10_CPA03g01057 [Acorus calamus]|uniref:Protein DETOXIFICATION n=1 Tax=Acorus calamus TaxID=4465 RepID=A0AAV9F997_ACOCL|nr:hypothetical protein QJS10_CPA03g01057 [Acorus calamus]